MILRGPSLSKAPDGGSPGSAATASLFILYTNAHRRPARRSLRRSDSRASCDESRRAESHDPRTGACAVHASSDWTGASEAIAFPCDIVRVEDTDVSRLDSLRKINFALSPFDFTFSPVRFLQSCRRYLLPPFHLRESS